VKIFVYQLFGEAEADNIFMSLLFDEAESDCLL
jgi:hypothetical protein